MEYKKSLEDEIDWKIIDQLHSATLNFSNSSLELKKLLFVLIGIAIPSLIKLAGDKLNASLFVTIYVLGVAFWILDSFAYFHQEKLREKMDMRFEKIKERNKPEVPNQDDFTLEDSRTSKNRFWRSAFNFSIGIYPLMLFLNTIATFLFIFKVIK